METLIYNDGVITSDPTPLLSSKIGSCAMSRRFCPDSEYPSTPIRSWRFSTVRNDASVSLPGRRTTSPNHVWGYMPGKLFGQVEPYLLREPRIP